ncbi:MAG TPA: antibiotic biosynthesis monooxygenase [Mycobacteriales bacterium]|jgi:quinol monooxygenase YgiN|nr:antibiotic biosynthesis monooxygenase [Mycobacteriales bacterium]
MAQVAVVAKLTAVDGKADELKAVIDELVKAVDAGEPDTLVYAAAQDDDDPSVFWFYELYPSAEAAAAHSGGSALADAGVNMRGLLAGRPEVHRLTPVASTGLPS